MDVFKSAAYAVYCPIYPAEEKMRWTTPNDPGKDVWHSADGLMTATTRTFARTRGAGAADSFIQS